MKVTYSETLPNTRALKPGTAFVDEYGSTYIVIAMDCNTMVDPKYKDSLFTFNVDTNRISRYSDINPPSGIDKLTILKKLALELDK